MCQGLAEGHTLTIHYQPVHLDKAHLTLKGTFSCRKRAFVLISAYWITQEGRIKTFSSPSQCLVPLLRELLTKVLHNFYPLTSFCPNSLQYQSPVLQLITRGIINFLSFSLRVYFSASQLSSGDLIFILTLVRCLIDFCLDLFFIWFKSYPVYQEDFVRTDFIIII